MNGPASYSGQHWLIEFHDATHLTEVDHIESALRDATAAAHATLLRLDLHQFGGHGGVAGVAMLSESHISIHTWPEFRYAAIDLFMCGHYANPEGALRVLQDRFGPKQVEVKRFTRGYSLSS